MTIARARIILMIGDDGVIVVPHDIKGAAPFFVANDDRGAVAEITGFIAVNPRARVTLFADTLAQDYRTDTLLPGLSFFDRVKIIQRRLKQTFPTARLTAHSRLKASPRDILLIGLHESNPVLVWADRLRERLPDIALLPVEGARLITKLFPTPPSAWTMTISFHRSGGFRQIVTRKGDLVFTRLTPLPPESDNVHDYAPALAGDIKASLDYMTRHGLRDPKELNVVLLMPGDPHTSSAFKNLPVHSLHSLSPWAAAQKLALPFAPEPQDIAADLLFAGHLLVKRFGTLSLMLTDTRKIWQTRKIQQWGLRTACAAGVFVSLALVWQAGDIVSTFFQIRKESAALADMRRDLAHLQADAAPLTEPLGRLRQAVERRRIYETPTATPWQAFNALTTGIDDNAKINSLTWTKESESAPESINVILRINSGDDRAATVASFERSATLIAQAMPDFSLSIIKPPYPDLPQEQVTATPQNLPDNPEGEIRLQREIAVIDWAAHKIWLGLLLFAIVAAVGGTPLFDVMRAAEKGQLESLRAQKQKTSDALRQMQEDIAATERLKTQIDSSEAEKSLAPVDRLRAAQLIEHRATQEHLSHFSYTLAPEEKTRLPTVGAGIQELATSPLSLTADAPTDIDAYFFLDSLARSLPGRLTLRSLSLQRIDTGAADISNANIRFTAKMEWLSNGASSSIAAAQP